jgi:hypothetical protein
MIPSNGREAPSDVAIQDTGEGTKGRGKRRKKCLQEATIVVNGSGGNDKQAGGSNVLRVVTTTGSSKHQPRLPTNHFEKLLEESCPNHAYPIKHKLMDYDMMKNFMASRSLTRGMELDEVPDGGDVTPFLREDVVMMIYDGCPLVGMRHVSNPSPGTPACCGSGLWGCREVRTQVS